MFHSILQSLQNKSYNHFAAIYYLLVERLKAHRCSFPVEPRLDARQRRPSTIAEQTLVKVHRFNSIWLNKNVNSSARVMLTVWVPLFLWAAGEQRCPSGEPPASERASPAASCCASNLCRLLHFPTILLRCVNKIQQNEKFKTFKLSK